MSTTKFESKKLAKDIIEKRTKENLSFRDIAVKMKIPVHILFRTEVANSKLSCDNLAKITSWLGKPVTDYFTTK